MAEYGFRLPAVAVTVTSDAGGRGPRFVATVTDAAGEVIGRGEDWTEPGAVGLAVLAARQAFAVCNGCGGTFYRDEMEKDAAGLWYCGDCAWDRMIPDDAPEEAGYDFICPVCGRPTCDVLDTDDGKGRWACGRCGATWPVDDD